MKFLIVVTISVMLTASIEAKKGGHSNIKVMAKHVREVSQCANNTLHNAVGGRCEEACGDDCEHSLALTSCLEKCYKAVMGRGDVTISKRKMIRSPSFLKCKKDCAQTHGLCQHSNPFQLPYCLHDFICICADCVLKSEACPKQTPECKVIMNSLHDCVKGHNHNHS